MEPALWVPVRSVAIRMMPSLRWRRIWILAVLLLTAALAVLGARGFQRKLEAFQPLGFEAAPGGDHWEIRAVDRQLAPGLEVGDRLVLVDGREVARSGRLAESLRAQASSELVVLRGVALLTVPYTRPALDLDGPYLVLALIGCAYLAVGLYLLWRSEQGLLFFVWCLASAVLYIFTPVVPLDRLGKAIFFLDEMARLLLPPLTLHLFLTIPKSAAPRIARLAPFLYLPAAILLALQSDMAFAGGAILSGPPTVARFALLDRIELAHLLLFAGIAIAVLVRRLRDLTDWEQHRQLLWLTVGMTAGYLPFFLFHGLPAMVGLRLPEALSTLTVLPLVCVPFAFAWAVLRYRLWDLGVMVRDGMSYGLTAILGVTTFSLIDLALRRSLPEGLTFARDLATFFGGVLVLGLIVPAHRGIHGALERLQYGNAFGRRRGLARVGQELLQERDLDRLCAALLSELTQGLDLERSNLLLPQGPSLVPVRPEPGLPRAIALASLREELWDGDFETLSPIGLPGEPASSEQQLYGAGYRYGFPLAVRGSRVGLAVTTLRRDHLPMSSEDVDIARGLLDQAALAIENAQLLDQVHRQLERVTTLQRYNQDILESSPAGIVVLDDRDCVSSANLAFAALVGRTRSELLGRAFAELLPRVELPPPGSGMHQLAIPDEAGADRHLQVTAAPLGEGVGAGRRVVVLQDVTERVRLERALKEQDRLAALGVLAAGVAHEVNTPLTGISSYAQMLLSETADDDPRRELLKKVERQTFRASRIVNNLLDFARQREHEIGDLDLGRLITETIDLVEDRFTKRGVRLVWQAPAMPVAVRGSEGELQQVVTNLLLNALDATAENGGGEIEVQLADDGESARIVVEDDGPGIRAENLPHIFEPFFTTKSGKGGTGLGLAISRDIAEQHGGSIQAENLREGGCRFVVELPAARSGAPDS